MDHKLFRAASTISAEALTGIGPEEENIPTLVHTVVL